MARPHRSEMRMPTEDQIEQMGFIRCTWNGCKLWIDPANMPSRLCRSHEDQRARIAAAKQQKGHR